MINGVDERGSQCAISNTVEGEWLEYIFETTSNVTVDVSLRIASERTDKTIRVEIDSIDGYGQVKGPGTDWNTYQTCSCVLGSTLVHWNPSNKSHVCRRANQLVQH